MTKARRTRLLLEMAGLFLLAPVAVAALRAWMGIPLIAMILPLFILMIAILSRDRTFSWRETLKSFPTLRQVGQILALFAALALVLIAFVAIWMPDQLFFLPRERPGLWFTILLLYPVISVTAQEILYRVLFFHRYGALFGNQMMLAVSANAALFAFAHLIFESWITIAVSFLGGLIFAWRYAVTGSFWAVVLEHGLYGILIFSIGLERYFLTGIPLD